MQCDEEENYEQNHPGVVLSRDLYVEDLVDCGVSLFVDPLADHVKSLSIIKFHHDAFAKFVGNF